MNEKQETIAGNSAAMREALEKIAHYAEDMCRMDDPYSADWRICADIARKALSLPPRNCDLYANYFDAYQAWEHLPKNELGYFVLENGVECCEEAWLFEPAERKGGAYVK